MRYQRIAGGGRKIITKIQLIKGTKYIYIVKICLQNHKLFFFIITSYLFI